MRALIVCPEGDVRPRPPTSDRVRWRPDLKPASDVQQIEALTALRANALITTGRCPGPEHLGRWVHVMKGQPIALIQITAGEGRAPAARLPSMEPPQPQAVVSGIPIFTVPAGGDAVLRALTVAERTYQEQQFHAHKLLAAGSGHGMATRQTRARGGSALVVGAGVVGLVVAHRLAGAGIRVTILDAGPDPRQPRPWTEYGCSRGGGNARMFTLTEADDYHDQSVTASPSGNRQFDRPPSESGWDIRKPKGPQNPADRAWVEDFKRVPGWLARAYNHDTFGLNRRSGELWDEWLRADSHLFDGAWLRHDVLRLYTDPAQLAAGAARQARAGATLAHYSPAGLRDRFPALAEVAPGALAGGIMVRGFTVNVHDFMTMLLNDLVNSGATLHFDTSAERLERDALGRVEAIRAGTGDLFRSEHFVISPGPYGQGLLRDTESEGLIHGVLGCWATVPNLEPRLENSLKVARRGHPAEDANVTVARGDAGQPVLIFGSGYGWTGADPTNIDERQLEVIHHAVADTVQLLFPRAYHSAGGEPGLRASQRYCVRPWTASNLGICEVVRAASGVLVIVGGHNTGGFAQSPVIAESVLFAMQERCHPLHVLYHPSRARRALGRSA